MRILLGLFFIFLFYKSHACGNEYRTIIKLPVHDNKLFLPQILNEGGESFPYWLNGFPHEVADELERLKIALQKVAGKKSTPGDWLKDTGLLKEQYPLISDYALYELKVGDKKLAVQLLEKLYHFFPAEYNIVANLGTAYEVSGNNQKALELLRKAVEINPASHEKSEWIHIKILEQKLSQPPIFSSIINLGITDFPSYLKKDNFKFQQDPEELKKQIAFQLHERISFIKAPDPIVAQLILDFADLVAKQDGANAALPFYDFALKYGGNDYLAMISKRKETLLTKTTEIKTTFKWASMVWALPLLAFLLIFIAWIRNNRKQSIPD